MRSIITFSALPTALLLSLSTICDLISSTHALTLSSNYTTYNNASLDSDLLARGTTSGWSPAVALQDSQGVCPQWAAINCQSITEPNYCCHEGTYCAYGGEDNHIGCCADADTCTGYPPVISTTVWVPSATATTCYLHSGTTVTEYIGPVATTTTTATEWITGENTAICTTYYEHASYAGELPTTAAAQCGVALILSEAGGGLEALGAGFFIAVLNVLGGVLYWLRIV